MEFCLDVLKHLRPIECTTLEAIHMNFNDTKPSKKMLDLDESFADLRLEYGIGPSTTTNQWIEVNESNKTLHVP